MPSSVPTAAAHVLRNTKKVYTLAGESILLPLGCLFLPAQQGGQISAFVNDIRSYILAAFTIRPRGVVVMSSDY